MGRAVFLSMALLRKLKGRWRLPPFAPLGIYCGRQQAGRLYGFLRLRNMGPRYFLPPIGLNQRVNYPEEGGCIPPWQNHYSKYYCSRLLD